MKKHFDFILVLFLVSMLAGCSSWSASPSASNCYGSGQPGCEKYWEGGKPKSVVIEAKIDDDFVKKFHIPSKEKYINRNEVIFAKKWSKVGTSKLEKERALLECGSGDYFNDPGYIFMKNKSKEDYDAGLTMIQRCMINDGYRYLGNFIACESDDVSCRYRANIREVDKRINGEYCLKNPRESPCQPQPLERILKSEHCRKYPDVYFCQPDWYRVETCTRFPNSADCKPEE